ncbi:MAG: 50S ribosomal protein L17 [Planctomycetota bacterium]
MRHRKAGYKLNRTSSHRQAMLRNLAASLFEHGQVVTTMPKAKAVQPFVEKVVTKAKRGDLHARRRVISMLGRDRLAFDWRYLPKDATEQERQSFQTQTEIAEQYFELPPAEQTERNRYGELRKAPRLVRHIFENVAPRFADRQGGYTRIIKLGKHRLGDAAELVLIQFVGAEEGPEIGGRPSTRRRKADRRSAYFASIKDKVSAPGAAAAAPAEAPAESDAEGSDESAES